MKTDRRGLLRKEGLLLLYSPLSWAVLVFFTVAVNLVFFLVQKDIISRLNDISLYFTNIPVILLVILPVLTMGAWNRERKRGTDRILFAGGIPTFIQLAVKTAAASLYLLVMIILILPVPFLLAAAWNKPPGEIFVFSAAVFLSGIFVYTAGLFFSALTGSQAGSYFLTILYLLFIFFVPVKIPFVRPSSWPPVYLNTARHLDYFFMGVMSFPDIIYFLTGSLVSLLAASAVINRQRRKKL
jgi:ABC-2 type transport system permease protein